jgi:hypothetical protein
MDTLPAAIQKEIWEYVRGDRAFWRGRFADVVNSLEPESKTLEQFAIGSWTVNLSLHKKRKMYTVSRYFEDEESGHVTVRRFDQSGNDQIDWATSLFHDKVAFITSLATQTD